MKGKKTCNICFGLWTITLGLNTDGYETSIQLQNVCWCFCDNVLENSFKTTWTHLVHFLPENLKCSSPKQRKQTKHTQTSQTHEICDYIFWWVCSWALFHISHRHTLVTLVT